MKILVIHNAYRFRGGEEQSVALQIAALEASGHQVISYRKNSQDISGLSGFGKLRAAIATPYSPRVFREVSELIHGEKPQLVHVHNVFPLITASAIRAAAKNGVPVVYSHHNYRLSCPSGLRFLRGDVCDRCTGGFFLPAVLNRCVQHKLGPSLTYALALQIDRIIGTFRTDIAVHVCPSRSLQRQLEKIMPTGTPIEIIPHFLPDHSVSERKAERPYIVYLGRISEEKGVMLLAKAAKDLTKYMDIEVLGDGPLREELAQGLSAREENQVHFRGHLANDRRFEFLTGALALVVPSLSEETFSYAVLEAFRAGVPVVAARVGALEELVEEEVNGLLFPRGSHQGMVAAIMRLHRDIIFRNSLARGARESFMKKYTMDVGYQALMDCYRRVLAARRQDERIA
ncbi:MAG TPA: glycosyltransferase family 4 protein [Candidatus Polarisedimenticolia bacterium]|nr:glycosyltransferase family 4 protein [Candidatus Polarisedimenticolia bacterium]